VELPAHILATRGRIMLEPHAPFYISSCSSMAAKLFRTSSAKLAGRRVRAIAQPAEIAELEQATRERMRSTGQLHVAVQTCKSMAGRMQIEVLLFPAEEESYFNEIALDSIESQATLSGSYAQYKDLNMSQVESDNFYALDKDLAMSPVESDRDKVLASVGSHCTRHLLLC